MGDSGNNKTTSVAVVVGVVLVVIGVYNLGQQIVPGFMWERLGALVRGLWGIVWPCALVAAGGYMLWASKKGKLAGFSHSRNSGMAFRRSRTDKRLLGVCGGIAYYFGVDSTMVRVIAVILLFIMPPTAFLAYALLALLVPQE